MQYVYQSYNTLCKTYSFPVMRDADPNVYGKQLHDFIILSPDQAKKERLDECLIYCIGQFDQESGKILFASEDQTGEIILDGVAAIKQLEALKNAAAASN